MAGRNQFGQYARGRGCGPIMDAATLAQTLERIAWEEAHPAEAAAQNARQALERVRDFGRTDMGADGRRRRYDAPVDGRSAVEQVRALGGDLLITFQTEGKTRLLLAATSLSKGGIPEFWLHLPETDEVFRHDGKYTATARLIIARRAFERDGGAQKRVAPKTATAPLAMAA